MAFADVMRMVKNGLVSPMSDEHFHSVILMEIDFANRKAAKILKLLCSEVDGGSLSKVINATGNVYGC